MRRLLYHILSNCIRFQSTHPRGVRPAVVAFNAYQDKFQSTHPRGVRLLITLLCNLCLLCFNPRTHEGCDTVSRQLATYPVVSIHAPTRGATDAAVNGAKLTYVSIHAPTRGATHSMRIQTILQQFQSTHPRGVRLSGQTYYQPKTGFNPRTHEGCDGLNLKYIGRLRVFQSTHPRGVRLMQPK